MHHPPRSSAIYRKPSVWLATGLGVGLVAPAPGTFGALWGLPLVWAYGLLPGAYTWYLVAAAMVAVGVPLCHRAAMALGGKDPGPVVWDEFSTVPLVFAAVPCSSISVAALGFALHRLMDIGKPWPCRQLERLPGGWGIMLDDVAAAVYAAAVLWLVIEWAP